MITQELRNKISDDMPLTMQELIAATGYSRHCVSRINPPMVQRRCRMSAFKVCEAKAGKARQAAVLARAAANRQPTAGDKCREPSSLNGPRAASRVLSEFRRRNSG